MNLKLRAGTLHDIQACGRVCFEAFSAVAKEHGFPSDIPTLEAGVGLVSECLNHPNFYSVVAEVNGRVVGSNFLDERSVISAVGPITVAPAVQNEALGRALMENVVRRAADRGAAGVRLVQAGYNNRSLSLYAKLGFHARDLLACMQGAPPKDKISGHRVRPATGADWLDCARLCHKVHGHNRLGELLDAIERGTALVVEHDNRVSGYATDLAFFAHAVGENDEDIKALITAAEAYRGTGILVPITNAPLFEWCLDRGLRVVHTMTLMTIGPYAAPKGSYLPSVAY
jgi:GNAT superfamily N-acetyltransferase